MSNQDDLASQRFAWLRSGFDIEGWVGALAAWLAALLLGFVWAPLFWLGFACAVIILLATRTAKRTSPGLENALIAPCDGTIVSIDRASLPNALRLEGENWTRIRVSSAPVTSNGLYAPMGGEIDHILSEEGDNAAIIAMRPDAPGLAVSYIAFANGGHQVGLRVAAGGFGPRLEVNVESGDAVRLGRHIGTRRLGGWCDIYVPSGTQLSVFPGQTLIGAETVLALLDAGSAAGQVSPSSASSAAVEEPTPEPDPMVDLDEADEQTLEELTSDDTDKSETPAQDAEQADITKETKEPGEEDDVSQMFARLKKEAQKARDEGTNS